MHGTEELRKLRGYLGSDLNHAGCHLHHCAALGTPSWCSVHFDARTVFQKARRPLSTPVSLARLRAMLFIAGSIPEDIILYLCVTFTLKMDQY
jgi:hypothetical protein